jgi:UDP-3-O-[3-hydroxymyristoyl] glucosamine N-acyltransferase
MLGTGSAFFMKKTVIHKEAAIMIQETENQPIDRRMIHSMTSIHPDARLAPDVQVDPFSMIHKNVEIGAGTWIGSNVTIMEGARIGKNCKDLPWSGNIR